MRKTSWSVRKLHTEGKASLSNQENRIAKPCFLLGFTESAREYPIAAADEGWFSMASAEGFSIAAGCPPSGTMASFNYLLRGICREHTTPAKDCVQTLTARLSQRQVEHAHHVCHGKHRDHVHHTSLPDVTLRSSTHRGTGYMCIWRVLNESARRGAIYYNHVGRAHSFHLYARC